MTPTLKKQCADLRPTRQNKWLLSLVYIRRISYFDQIDKFLSKFVVFRHSWQSRMQQLSYSYRKISIARLGVQTPHDTSRYKPISLLCSNHIRNEAWKILFSSLISCCYSYLNETASTIFGRAYIIYYFRRWTKFWSKLRHLNVTVTQLVPSICFLFRYFNSSYKPTYKSIYAVASRPPGKAQNEEENEQSLRKK